jgi:hypothetical protein
MGEGIQITPFRSTDELYCRYVSAPHSIPQRQLPPDVPYPLPPRAPLDTVVRTLEHGIFDRVSLDEEVSDEEYEARMQDPELLRLNARYITALTAQFERAGSRPDDPYEQRAAQLHLPAARAIIIPPLLPAMREHLRQGRGVTAAVLRISTDIVRPQQPLSVPWRKSREPEPAYPRLMTPAEMSSGQWYGLTGQTMHALRLFVQHELKKRAPNQEFPLNNQKFVRAAAEGLLWARTAPYPANRQVWQSRAERLVGAVRHLRPKQFDVLRAAIGEEWCQAERLVGPRPV